MLNSKFSFTGLFILILLSVFLISGCQPQKERTYTDAELQAIWDNNIHLWSTGNVDLVDTLYAEGCVRHNLAHIKRRLKALLEIGQ